MGRPEIDPNVQTILNDDSTIFRQTALHLAILSQTKSVIKEMLALANPGGLDLNLKNSKDQTPIGLALATSQHEVAIDLLKGE